MLLKIEPLPAPFSFYFRLFNTVHGTYKLMTGFEPWISDVGTDRSTNCATTTAHIFFILLLRRDYKYCTFLHFCIFPQNWYTNLFLPIKKRLNLLLLLAMSMSGCTNIVFFLDMREIRISFPKVVTRKQNALWKFYPCFTSPT